MKTTKEQRNESKRMLENAEQQFAGFAIGYYFKDIIELVTSMGLDESEWKKLKRKEMLNCIEDKEKKEVNKYFRERK